MNITVIGEYLKKGTDFLIGPYSVRSGRLNVLHVDEETFLFIAEMQKRKEFSIKSHTYLQYLQAKDIEAEKVPNFDLVDIYSDYCGFDKEFCVNYYNIEPQQTIGAVTKTTYTAGVSHVVDFATNDDKAMIDEYKNSPLPGQIDISEIVPVVTQEEPAVTQEEPEKAVFNKKKRGK